MRSNHELKPVTHFPCLHQLFQDPPSQLDQMSGLSCVAWPTLGYCKLGGQVIKHWVILGGEHKPIFIVNPMMSRIHGLLMCVYVYIACGFNHWLRQSMVSYCYNIH